jgi:hypothetical protein
VKTSYEFEAAAAEFEQVLRGLAGMQDASVSPPAKAWNRLHSKLASLRRALGETEEGRAFISRFLHDPSSTVRLETAAAALFWDEDRARVVLEEIRDGEYMLQKVTAKYTLLEFDKGHLENLRPAAR